ncbi:MAG: hypothetical protein CVV48_16905 [Spirochaetae bacterium HGW-Spirochaetae-4]|nr:MAG: hypothetical protein A2Y31_05610 [Spirochaetes bacterium GWC2_52_13]PKL19663.1 MAG: hypothetical protein CVV48_16905 [Spirochaetae bacterium HGW-Spirochaetae-4]HCG63341.1 hypothetical protein [Sphaerochaeta sp.]
MRSELINEIFSVEAEAEKIVNEAQQNGRLLVSRIQEEGEKEVRLAIETARQAREAAIEAAQRASAERIQAAKTAMEQSDSDNLDIQECARTIAESLVEILCRTQLGENTL